MENLNIEDLEKSIQKRTRTAEPRISITGAKSLNLSFNRCLIEDERFKKFFINDHIKIFFSKNQKIIAFAVPEKEDSIEKCQKLTKQQSKTITISINSLVNEFGLSKNELRGHYKPKICTISTPKYKKTVYLTIQLDKMEKEGIEST